MRLDKREVVERLKKAIRERRAEGRPFFNMNVVFGLGSGGCNILASLGLPEHVIKVGINSNIRDLVSVGDRLDLTIPCGEGRGSGMMPEKGREDFMQVAEYVPTIIQEVCSASNVDEPDVVSVIATLGHGFGSGSVLPCCDMIRRNYPNSIADNRAALRDGGRRP